MAKHEIQIKLRWWFVVFYLYPLVTAFTISRSLGLDPQINYERFEYWFRKGSKITVKQGERDEQKEN